MSALPVPDRYGLLTLRYKIKKLRDRMHGMAGIRLSQRFGGYAV